MLWQAVCAPESLQPNFIFTVIFASTLCLMLALMLAYLCGKDHDGTEREVRFRWAAWLKMGAFALLLGLLAAWLMHRHTFCEWKLDSEQISLRLPYATDRTIRREAISEIRLAFPQKHSCGIAIYTAGTRYASGGGYCPVAKKMKEQLRLWRQTGQWEETN